jgi:hypothetical protein
MAGADELYQRTITRYGKDNLFATEAIAQRARLLQMTGHPGEAVPLYEQALVGLRKYVGEQSPNIVAVLSHLTESYAAAGRVADAERTLDATRAAGARHPGDDRIAGLLAQTEARLAQIKAGKPPHCGT